MERGEERGCPYEENKQRTQKPGKVMIGHLLSTAGECVAAVLNWDHRPQKIELSDKTGKKLKFKNTFTMIVASLQYFEIPLNFSLNNLSP